MKKIIKKIRNNNILNKLLKIIEKPEMRILPGNMAFFLFLSIFPVIMLVVYFANMLSLSIDDVIDIITVIIPPEVSKIIMPYFIGSHVSFTTIASMLVGFYLASNASKAIIVISNELYKIDIGNVVRSRIKAFFMTIILILLFIFILVILAFGDKILNFIFLITSLNELQFIIKIIYIILKWSLAIFIVFFLVKILYTISLNKNIPSKHTTKGAIFTTISFSIVSTVYSYYVTNFTNYDMIYGSLSSIIILMMFIYILSYIFVFGIAINASIYEMVNNTSHINNKKSK